ncbi:LysR substrate-binding domain-containing protein [Alloalcanivorax gelatiniphagus]|uniref:LysR family transcriptional regulator n=1 Tax=Alloalcanivorax gelatiniphagus TaxID=1194167 RepID=A0ABY2XJR3_9GAMM|nr:LysR substrate-binding domain-containing protein [Alloalcanivorax gelatiniphagus]TMW11659.1 LysR family transcriptional regulator [Alloalcanivorax gelatiniphagus]|tara:strand:+ start:14407 stop:15315 length:909 start_codon:yes stop_codon:yes gene_type:complete
MRRKIPSTTALVGFEAAARHQSFTKAAEELSLTQSAICRQIGGLEEFLGVKLFRRGRQGVQLTPAGQHYSRQVSARLNELERDTLAAMGKHGTNNILELALVPTFGTRWLLPRLSSFREQHPDVTVNLTNRTRPFLFADTRFDAAIYFGDGQWPGTTATPLMHEEPVPVCHPDLAGDGPLDGEAIARLPLLQQTTRPYMWRAWFDSLGLKVDRDMAGPRYELFTMLAEAAIQKIGVALIPPFLITKELESGQLVIPFRHSFRSTDAYQFVVPDSQRGNETVARFQEWLVEEARRFQTAEAGQ